MLPSKVKIGGSTYDLVYTKDLENEEGTKLWGQISENKGAITLESSIKGKPEQHANTFLHECLHGILIDRGIDHEEKLIVNFTNGLIALFKNNPKILPEITKMLK